jgi:hypothetical protein
MIRCFVYSFVNYVNLKEIEKQFNFFPIVGSSRFGRLPL